jgi:hypothetical protein
MSTTSVPSGAAGEQTLLQVALARLDQAALAVMGSHATVEEQHEILGSLVAAHSLLHALHRLDPAAVEEAARACGQARPAGQPPQAHHGRV